MTSSRAWRPLGSVDPSALESARLQLHWAAQLVSAVGKTHIKPRPDDSHPNMEWWETLGSLVGNPTETNPVFRVALQAGSLTILVLDSSGDMIDAFPLRGQTMADGFAWIESSIRNHSKGRVDQPLDRVPYDIPEHEVASGQRFEANAHELEEMAAWFSNGDLAMRALAAGLPTVTTVRCWPHHFDIGALYFIDVPAGREGERSVGLGMTPGDVYYGEPYWYVNPYPAPEDIQSLPPLDGGGQWHREDWFGAVLQARNTIVRTGPDQEAHVMAFLQSATKAAGTILGS